MANKHRWDVIIIGGGLAGLCAALHLSKENYKICLIERNNFPHHKVCGEYVSNEVLPYLNFLGIDPFSLSSKKYPDLKLQIPTAVPSKQNCLWAALESVGMHLTICFMNH